MSCSSCGKPKTEAVKIKSSYNPTPNIKVKMSDVLLSFTIEKTKNNDTTTTNTESPK